MSVCNPEECSSVSAILDSYVELLRFRGDSFYSCRDHSMKYWIGNVNLGVSMEPSFLAFNCPAIYTY